MGGPNKIQVIIWWQSYIAKNESRWLFELVYKQASKSNIGYQYYQV